MTEAESNADLLELENACWLLFQGLRARFSLKMIHWIIFQALKLPNPNCQRKRCG